MVAPREKVIILDSGGQFGQLIARQIRNAKVYCEIMPFTTSIDKIMAKEPKAIILSGNPRNVNENTPLCDKKIFKKPIPILGIGYGMQIIVKLLDGKLSPAGKENREISILLENDNKLFSNIDQNIKAYWSCRDEIISLPKGFEAIARDSNDDVCAISDNDNIWALGFHPELNNDFGPKIIEKFLFDIAECSKSWSMDAFIEKEIQEIRQKVGKRRVICALSGGVDSSVAAVLAHKAIGEQLYCIFVDHGLLRKNEAEQVVKTFRDKFHMNLVHVNAKDRFLSKLKDIEDPEEKRKIIGEEFIRVFEDEARKLGEIAFLVQGTVYPDIIESGTDEAEVVKSHHNVGGLPEDLQFELIEPLRELFKDEVREIGKLLDMPDEIIYRQPFPGPGLAIRILGAVTEEKLNILREADHIVQEEIKAANLYHDIWQSFAVLPNIRSVGVKDGKRTYTHTIAIRAVESHDGMTAQWVRLPYEVIDKISKRIVEEVDMVNRIVYDVTAKPPSTIEWE